MRMMSGTCAGLSSYVSCSLLLDLEDVGTRTRSWRRARMHCPGGNEAGLWRWAIEEELHRVADVTMRGCRRAAHHQPRGGAVVLIPGRGAGHVAQTVRRILAVLARRRRFDFDQHGAHRWIAGTFFDVRDAGAIALEH